MLWTNDWTKKVKPKKRRNIKRKKKQTQHIRCNTQTEKKQANKKEKELEQEGGKTDKRIEYKNIETEGNRKMVVSFQK